MVMPGTPVVARVLRVVSGIPAIRIVVARIVARALRNGPIGANRSVIRGTTVILCPRGRCRHESRKRKETDKTQRWAESAFTIDCGLRHMSPLFRPGTWRRLAGVYLR